MCGSSLNKPFIGKMMLLLYVPFNLIASLEFKTMIRESSYVFIYILYKHKLWLSCNNFSNLSCFL